MTKLKAFLYGLAVAGALLLAAAPSAYAGSATAGHNWNDGPGFQDPEEQQVQLNGALYQLQLRKHMVPGTTNVYENIGTENQTNTSTFNGPVSNSGATNENNVNSTNAQAYSSSQITVTSGQSSETTQQGASSQQLENSSNATSSTTNGH